MPGQVEEDHLEPPLGQVGGQAPAELVVEQEPVQEHEHLVALSVALIVQAQPLDREARLVEGAALEEPGHEGDGRNAGQGAWCRAPRLGRSRAVHRTRAEPVVARPVPRPGARTGSRSIGSADPGPHGRHGLDDTRAAFPGASPGGHQTAGGGVRPGQMSRSRREQAGHWPQPLRAWSFWAAWSCTAGEAFDGSPGKPSPCQVDRLNW